MTTRAIEQLDQWETRPFSGGYGGVHDLADRDFSGVIRVGAATLCMLNGNVVGILDGSIEDFEDAEGTAYVAPSPALPLLIVMQERSEEVRAKYYTEDTPLSKVDETLSDGGFTGYVELSENVLSGDYYTVYHGGRSMSVAFVGGRGELLTDEEAFETADGEVGIYAVRPVDIDVIDVPEPDPDPSDETASAHPVDADAPASDASDNETTQSDDGATAPASAAGPDEPNGVDDERGVADDEPSDSTGDVGGDTDTAGTDTAGDVAVAESADDTPVDTEDESAADPPDREQSAPDTADTDAAGTAPTRDDGNTGEADPTTGSTATEPTDTGPQEDAVDHGVETTSSRGSEREQSAAEPDSAERSHPGDSTSGERWDPLEDRDSGPDPRQQATETTSDRPERESGQEAVTAPGTHSGAVDRADDPHADSSGTDLETRTIPSLDPANTWDADEQGPGTSTVPVPPTEDAVAGSADQQPSGTDRANGRHESPATDTTGRTADSPSESQANSGTAEHNGTAKHHGTAGHSGTAEHNGTAEGSTPEQSESAQVSDLRETIDQREARIDDLTDRVETLESKRDDLQEERDELAAERDDLQAELESVQSELASLREERDTLAAQLEDLDVDTASPEQRLSPQEAIDGTNLFVRYDSKSAPTLTAARESGAGQSDVRENLSIEVHTQFETAGTHVNGEPFETFITGTIEYRFVTWVIEELLFEIRDTGHRDEMADLYDGLPQIDRIELNGSVSVEFTEDGQTNRSQESFDVVVRDRMGNPLVVANVNDSRQAATENQLNGLVTAATRVGETADSLAGAMFVTSSFFEPEALEMTAEATGGGLLSRDKRESFVKLSRKQGYHLCLVEARDEQFHMAVPEL